MLQLISLAIIREVFMLENLAWIFENIQKLEGVPVTEHNISILFLTLVKLKEIHHTLEKEDTDGEAETENRQAPDPG